MLSELSGCLTWLFERCCDSDGIVVINVRLESTKHVVMSLQ